MFDPVTRNAISPPQQPSTDTTPAGGRSEAAQPPLSVSAGTARTAIFESALFHSLDRGNRYLAAALSSRQSPPEAANEDRSMKSKSTRVAGR